MVAVAGDEDVNITFVEFGDQELCSAFTDDLVLDDAGSDGLVFAVHCGVFRGVEADAFSETDICFV